jgi:aryl-alcohol dehydrogenase-like predicted oxidoreductase
VLERLKAEGKIDAFGWSTDYPDRAERQARREGFVAVQHNMNVLSPATDLLAVIRRYGLISIGRGPLAMGLLSGKFTGDKAIGEKDVRGAGLDWMIYFKDGRAAPEFARMLDAIRELLRTDGRTLPQGALAWLWAKYDRTLPIPGFRAVAQVEENAGALDRGPLPKPVADEIDAVLRKAAIAA